MICYISLLPNNGRNSWQVSFFICYPERMQSSLKSCASIAARPSGLGWHSVYTNVPPFILGTMPLYSFVFIAILQWKTLLVDSTKTCERVHCVHRVQTTEGERVRRRSTDIWYRSQRLFQPWRQHLR